MTYDDRNEGVISKLDPAVQPKVRQLLQIEASKGRDLLADSGFRTAAEQNALWQEGRDANGKIIGPVVTNAKAGQSTHCYGCAVDLVPVGPNGTLEWGNESMLAAVAVDAKQLGFAWGGDWSTFKGDYGHFEFTGGLSLAQLQRGLRPTLPQSNVTLADLQAELKVAKAAKGKPWLKLLRERAIDFVIPRLERAIQILKGQA